MLCNKSAACMDGVKEATSKRCRASMGKKPTCAACHDDLCRRHGYCACTIHNSAAGALPPVRIRPLPARERKAKFHRRPRIWFSSRGYTDLLLSDSIGLFGFERHAWVKRQCQYSTYYVLPSGKSDVLVFSFVSTEFSNWFGGMSEDGFSRRRRRSEYLIV